MYPVGSTFKFRVEFYDVDGEPFVPSDCSITIIAPDGTTTSAAGTQVGTTTLFERSGVLTAGAWAWYGTTTDVDAETERTKAQHLFSTVSPPTIEELVTALTDLQVTLVSPVADDGTTVSVIRGDTYDEDEVRSIVWTLTDPTYSLAGATCYFVTNTVQIEMDVDDAEDTLTLELTAAQTEALSASRHRYQVRLILANDHVVTPVQGYITVTDGIELE